MNDEPKRARIQFRISDLIVAMFIIGAFPLALECVIGTPKPAGRIAFLLFGAGVEFGALVWGSEISNTFKIENFFARGVVQLYSFVAVLALIVSTIQWISTIIVVTFASLSLAKTEKPSELFITSLAFSTIIVMSMYVVQCKRADFERRSKANQESNEA